MQQGLRVLLSTVLTGSLLAPSALWAQPSAPTPAPVPPPAPTPSVPSPETPEASPDLPAPETPTDAQPEAPSPPPQVDPMEEAYQRAFQALVDGRLAIAQAEFSRVAAASSNAERRAAAAELSRLAGRMIAESVRVVRGGPGFGVEPLPPTRSLEEEEKDTAGRTAFVSVSTLASLYAGITLTVVADVDDVRGVGAILMLTTGAGFAASLWGTRNTRIPAGVASSYGLGITNGLTTGLLMASPLGFDDNADAFTTSGLGGMLLGGGVGYLLGSQKQPTQGQIGLAQTAGLMGIATVGLGLVVVDPDDIEGDSVLTLLALGLNGGTVASLLVAGDVDWSGSRVSLTALGAGLGALGGFGTAAVIGGDELNSQTVAASILGGMWLGFGLGAHFTRDMAPDVRYAKSAQPSISFMPSVIRDAPALAIMGTM